MPSSIFQGVLEIVFQALFELVGYCIGSFVVPVVSLGRWQCDSLSVSVPRKRLRAAGLYHLRNGRVFLTAETTSLVGVLTLLLIIGGGVLIWCLRSQ